MGWVMIRYRMGGPQAWKEMQEKQKEFQMEFNSGFAQDCSIEMGDDNGTGGTDTGVDFELETENERVARREDDTVEDLNDNVSLNSSDNDGYQ